VVTVYGIANCDTVKKARAGLVQAGVEHTFVDFNKGGVPEDRLEIWLEAVGWERLLNRRGTTWRKLADWQRAVVVDAASAGALMRVAPSVIRRPVVEWGDERVTVGVEAFHRV
jgi:Spx/MgsR family transcriptional regulator